MGGEHRVPPPPSVNIVLVGKVDADVYYFSLALQLRPTAAPLHRQEGDICPFSFFFSPVFQFA